MLRMNASSLVADFGFLPLTVVAGPFFLFSLSISKTSSFSADKQKIKVTLLVSFYMTLKAFSSKLLEIAFKNLNILSDTNSHRSQSVENTTGDHRCFTPSFSNLFYYNITTYRWSSSCYIGCWGVSCPPGHGPVVPPIGAGRRSWLRAEPSPHWSLCSFSGSPRVYEKTVAINKDLIRSPISLSD